jgi:sigma-E factor negative regulatory protein RseC
MIEEEATVVAVRGHEALVQTERRSTCSGCSARSGCGTGLLSRLIGRRFAEMSVPNELDLKVGDRVVLGLSETGLVKGAVAMYGLPLIGMLAGAVLAQPMASSAELVVVTGGALGLLAGLFLARIYLTKGASAAELRPTVLRRLPGNRIAGVGILAP